MLLTTLHRISLLVPTRPRQLVSILVSLLLATNVALSDIAGYNSAVDASKSGDYDKAFTIWQSLALEGHTPSQIALAIAYLEGQGVEKDLIEAMNWFRKAAEAGDTQAMFNIATAYYDGQGVEKDLIEAMNWFRKAAEAGDTQAMFNVGAAHWKGDGARQSYAEAVDWWQKAAIANHPDAQFNLGLTYYFGQGAEKDLEKALKWISQAAANGQSTAKEFVDEVRLEYAETILTDREKDVTSQNVVSLPKTDAIETETGDESIRVPEADQTLSDITVNSEKLPPVDYQASIVSKGGGQIYSAASNSSTVLADLQAGSPIKVLALNGDWARINSPGLARVWVFGRYVDTKKQIRGNRVRARSLPATTSESAVLGLFKEGEAVAIFGDNGQWKQVSSPPRFPLWMPIAQLQLLPSVTNDWLLQWEQAVATLLNTNIVETDGRIVSSEQDALETLSETTSDVIPLSNYSFRPAVIRVASAEILGSNSSDGPLLKLLLKDMPLKVITENAGWAQVLIPTPLNVWVYGRYVEQTGDSAQIRGSQVRARSLPSTSAASTILGIFDNNVPVTVISKEGDWIRVSVRDSIPAWVKTAQVTILEQVTAKWTKRWESEQARP